MFDYIVIALFVLFMFFLINGMNREVMQKHIKKLEDDKRE
jgi:preprotein translocase subunit YajC